MRRGDSLAGLCLLSLCLVAADWPDAAADARVALTGNDERPNARAMSFLEMRERNLVRQGWDISCGAAALSTVLTHYYAAPYTEPTIAVSILANTDPDRVRQRGGFSLLDLKRFAEAVGFAANGYGQLTLADLDSFNAPVIVPVRIRGLDHFVVYRGRAAGKILIGDPAFGNLTLSEYQFQEFWTSGIGFVVEPADAAGADRAALASEAMHLTVPDLNYVFRLSTRGGPVPATRR